MGQRLCVVTGTSTGIGRAVATALLDAGWTVLGLARREGTLTHERYRHRRLDLSDLAAVERYFTGDFAREFGAADWQRVGLVNNAGLLQPVGPLPELPLEELGRAMSVNSTVPIWLMGCFLRLFPRTTLRIVNVSSGAATNARAGWAAYNASKAALLMAGQVFGLEAEQVPGTNADAAVLNYEPGMVDTDMQSYLRTVAPEQFPGVQRFRDVHAQGRLYDAALPAADMLAFLESDGEPAFSTARNTH